MTRNLKREGIHVSIRSEASWGIFCLKRRDLPRSEFIGVLFYHVYDDSFNLLR